MADMKLKNCPFCGSEPEHHVNLCARIVCKKCKARTDGHLEHSNAIAYWNIRATDSTIEAQEAEIKRLRLALEFYADKENTSYDSDGRWEYWFDGGQDFCKIAKEALR